MTKQGGQKDISLSFRPEHLTALRKASYNATVSHLRRVHEELIVLRVKPDSGISPHKAGQYTALGVGYWERRCDGCQEENLKPAQLERVVKRAYSLSSSVLDEKGELLRPEDEDFLEFYIVLVRRSDNGAPALTPRLFLLEEGDRLHVSEKITGRYTLDPVRPDDIVLLMATGTGEAPHNKMLLELIRRGHQGPMVSVVCVRYQRDLAYLETHCRLQEMVPNYRFIPLTTREASNRDVKIYIQDLVRSGDLEEQIAHRLDPGRTHVYLCGNPRMIGVPKKDRDGSLIYPEPPGTIEILESQGFTIDRPGHAGNIHFEEYW